MQAMRKLVHSKALGYWNQWRFFVQRNLENKQKVRVRMRPWQCTCAWVGARSAAYPVALFVTRAHASGSGPYGL